MSSSARVLLVGGCGYIGSFLHDKLIQSQFSVVVSDVQNRGNPAGICVDFGNYAELTTSDLAYFDAVLWFAGHSSVQQSMNDSDGAISNNCLDLYSFVKRLPAHVKFIYASTASLYSSKSSNFAASTEDCLVFIPSQNAYDASKFAFDYLAKNFLKNYFGIRMGTLSGFSNNLRPELVFNAMNIAAQTNGIIKLKNSSSMRTILFLEDLWILIKNLLFRNHAPGFYNAGSYTGSMGELALDIASAWDAKIQYEGDSETYSFSLDTTKMRIICGSELAQSSIREQCQKFITDYKRMGNGSSYLS